MPNSEGQYIYKRAVGAVELVLKRSRKIPHKHEKEDDFTLCVEKTYYILRFSAAENIESVQYRLRTLSMVSANVYL